MGFGGGLGVRFGPGEAWGVLGPQQRIGLRFKLQRPLIQGLGFRVSGLGFRV